MLMPTNETMTVRRCLLPLLLAIVFSLLALNAYWAFEFKQFSSSNDSSNNVVVSDNKRPSLLFHSNVQLQDELANKVKDLSTPLSFMVWPLERRVLSKPLQKALHAQINQKPYMLNAWRQLSFTEYYLQLPPKERVWSITVGAKLAWWKTPERLLFTRHCVVDYETLAPLIPSLCKALISSLPSDRSTLRLAQDMGVKVKYLQWLLLQNQQNPAVN